MGPLSVAHFLPHRDAPSSSEPERLFATSLARRMGGVGLFYPEVTMCDKQLVTVAGALAIVATTLLGTFSPLEVRATVVGIVGSSAAIGWWLTRKRRSRAVGFVAGDLAFKGHLINPPRRFTDEFITDMLMWLSGAAATMLKAGKVPLVELELTASPTPEPLVESEPEAEPEVELEPEPVTVAPAVVPVSSSKPVIARDVVSTSQPSFLQACAYACGNSASHLVDLPERDEPIPVCDDCAAQLPVTASSTELLTSDA